MSDTINLAVDRIKQFLSWILDLIVQFLSSIVELLSGILLPIVQWKTSEWLIATAVAAYLYATLRYWWLARKAIKTAPIAPISLRGKISKQLGVREAGLLLRAQLSRISETFQKDRQGDSSPYMAVPTDVSFHQKIRWASETVPVPMAPSDVTVKEDLVLEIGLVKIPVGAIVNLFVKLLHVLPVPFRKRYLASQIHVSLLSVGDQTALVVHRGVQRSGWFQWILRHAQRKRAANLPAMNRVILLTQKGTAKEGTAQEGTANSLKELDDIFREAAFMVLELHGEAFPGRTAGSMRSLADGLDALYEYWLTGESTRIGDAEESFGCAIAADPDNVEALYLYGSLRLRERKRESIAEAIRVFRRAVSTENRKLKALVHAGLANCYAQEFHRLAMREEGVLEKARTEAENARREWKNAVSAKLHPWILLTLALVEHVDEGSDDTRDDAKKRFLKAAGIYLQAIKSDPNNGMLHNNLGWVLLKMAEWEVKRLKADDRVPLELAGNPAETAERYFQRSIELNPKNKLTHANLCLLYATRWYREKGGKEYLGPCRKHGKEAIRLDPEYINGHRDLALSLLRYGEFDDAYEYFKDALRLAIVHQKDQEIIDDAMRVLEELDVEPKELKRWRRRNLDPGLLEPPGAGGAPPATGTGKPGS